MLESEVENDGKDTASNCWAGKCPDKVRILDCGGGGETNGSRDGSHKQVDRGDKPLHVLGGTSVGNTVCGDVDKDLRDGSNDDGDSIERVGDARQRVFALGYNAGTGGCILSARRSLVDVMLKNREAHGADGAESEAKGHARDGSPLDAPATEERVDDVVHDRDHDHDTNGVEVVEEIVGEAVGLHSGGKSVCGSAKTTIVDVEDGLEEEDAAGLECAADVVDELIVITVNLGASSGGADAGLSNLPESLAANGPDASVLEAVTENLEDVAEIRAPRRLLDNSGIEIPQERGEHEVEDGGNQVRGPISDDLGKIRSWDAKAGSHVYQEIKPQHHTVDGLFGVDDDLFAVLLNDMCDLVGRLVHKRWRNIWLEHGCRVENVSETT